MHLYSNTLPCSHQWEYKTETNATHRIVMRKCAVCGQSTVRRVRVAKASQKPLKPRKTTARKAIRKVSDKQAKVLKEYAKLRKQYLEKYPLCRVVRSEFAPHFHLCPNQSTQVHHIRRRGKYLLDTSTWLACCAECHTFIEQNPAWAKEQGYLQSHK